MGHHWGSTGAVLVGWRSMGTGQRRGSAEAVVVLGQCWESVGTLLGALGEYGYSIGTELGQHMDSNATVGAQSWHSIVGQHLGQFCGNASQYWDSIGLGQHWDSAGAVLAQY